MSFAWSCAVDSLLQDEMEKYLEKEQAGGCSLHLSECTKQLSKTLVAANLRLI